MIRLQDIQDRSGEWGLRPDIVEKDYALGWLLAAFALHPETSAKWIFKGGTCLKKVYYETYRFSEDLDFTLLPDAAYTEGDLIRILREVARQATDLSGIAFPEGEVSVKIRKDKQERPTFQGLVPYRGPRAVPPPLPKILLDLTQHEPVFETPEPRAIFHPYPDALPENARIPAYTIEELFAEKTRALRERTRPRDLYDVVYILENHPEELDLARARDLFGKKCRAKGFAPPTAGELLDLVRRDEELRSEWSSMLAHQLPALPALDDVLARLVPLLAWIGAPAPLPAHRLPAVPVRAGHQLVASPGIRYWGGPNRLEVVRFAGANRLLVEFTYHGKRRLAEPYSLRRPDTGNLLLYAWEQASHQIKAFKVDEIHDLQVTDQSFTPRYWIEFAGGRIS